MRTRTLIPRLLALLFLFGTTAAGQADSDIRTPQNRVIYEVFVRNFSPEGNLKGVENQIDRLKDLGVDVIWLMPIYTPGVEGKWGTYSSPYAVRDYKGIDPMYGNADDLHSLIDKAHDRGMEVWLDWVANHTSKDNVWVTQHPEYYGNNFYSPNGWNDVYQLDFSNTALHDAMIDAMQYWVSEFDVDGFRCDYASGPSDTFWEKATSRVLKNGKRVGWLAEDDSKPALVSNGWFDYNYAWYFHDRLLDFGRGGNVTTLRKDCADLHNESAYYGRSRMVYLSNHDVVQDKGGTENVHFHKYLRPLTLLEFTIYGMPLIYNGQEIQYKSGKIMLSEKTPIDWSNPDTEMTDLIKKLCNLKHTQRALDTGATQNTLVNHSTSDDKVYVYERTNKGESVVVMLNFGDGQSTFTVTSDLPGYTATDIFTGNVTQLNKGSQFTLPAQGYAVYIRTDGARQNTHNIYVADRAEWGNNVTLYSWNTVDKTTIEILGSWPGSMPEETVTISGVEYKKFVVYGHDGETANLIFNNKNNDKIQVNLGTITLDEENYYFATNGKSVNQFTDPTAPDLEFDEEDPDPVDPGDDPLPSEAGIYVTDKTGWDNLYVYAWADGHKDTEMFGGWPGTKFEETVVISGVTYKRVGFTGDGTNWNLIFNNNSEIQFDALTAPSGKNLFLEVYGNSCNQLPDPTTTEPSVKTYNIYIDDQSGWENMYLYAYKDGKPSLFGEWPGKKVTDTEMKDGKTYKVIRGITGSEETHNFIPHNNSGTQFDVEGSYPVNRDIYITVNPNGAVATSLTGIIPEEKTEPVYFTLQGSKAIKPLAPGLYIEKRGDTTRKIIVK